MPGGGLRWCHRLEAVATDHRYKALRVEVPEVVGMGEMHPLPAIGDQADRGTIGNGDVEQSSRNQDAMQFTEFRIWVGYMFQAVGHDGGIEGLPGQLKIHQIAHPDLHPILACLGGRRGTEIRPKDGATPGAEVHEDVSVAGTDLHDTQALNPIDSDVDVKKPPREWRCHEPGQSG